MLPCYCIDLLYNIRRDPQNKTPLFVFLDGVCVCVQTICLSGKKVSGREKCGNWFEPCSPRHFNYKKRLHLSSSSLNQTFTRNCVLKKCIYFSFSNECFFYSCGSEEVHGRIGGRKKTESKRFKTIQYTSYCK